MPRARSTIIALLAITICLSASVSNLASGQAVQWTASPAGDLPPPRQMPGSKIQVMLSTPCSTTSWDDRDPARETFALPLLYLHRGRRAATQADRTLTINVFGPVGEPVGKSVRSEHARTFACDHMRAGRSASKDASLLGYSKSIVAGIEVEIEAISLHVDVSTGERHTVRKRFLLPHRPCTQEAPCTVRWAFDASTMLSDLYSLQVKDSTGRLLWQSPHPDRPDFAVLDTWDVNPGEYTVRVFYATLFPFARGQADLDNRLSPAAVTDFIEHQFAPLILETWHTQFHTWGFGPIQPAWDRDKVLEILITDPPFALFGGTGTYTISTYGNGEPYNDRRLWWFSSNNSFREHDSLENAYRVVFAHEFFHLVQWNAMLSAGCSTHKWANVFIEAQGKFAPSVQYPELELCGHHSVRANTTYQGVARRFLQLRLNTSYEALEAETTHLYDSALYWRFLYEQFGGMGVIRAALEEMACGYDPDIVTSLHDVLDATLARLDGPYHTFEESLIAFAQANYALRLENGRCLKADPAECRSRYYDPHHIYTNHPSLEAELVHDGPGLTYRGTIGSSFGMDFLEVHLAPALQGQPLSITLQSEGARFSIQVWRLQDGETGPLALTQHPEPMEGAGGGLYTYTIPSLDTAPVDRLALIITRLDPGERQDPVGNYHLSLDSS